MYYTGIDLHKKTSFITTIDARGKIVTRANLQNVEEDILAYFAALGDKTKIVIESMSSWYWLYDLLTAEGYEVLILQSCEDQGHCFGQDQKRQSGLSYAGSASQS